LIQIPATNIILRVDQCAGIIDDSLYEALINFIACQGAPAVI
jgi:hypothetical protein